MFFYTPFYIYKIVVHMEPGLGSDSNLELSKNLVVLEKMAEHKILSWEVVVLDAYWTKIRVFT